MCKKLEIGLREQNFFQDNQFFFQNFDFNLWCKHEIKDKNEEICGRFSNTVSNEIVLTTFDFHRDHPPACE